MWNPTAALAAPGVWLVLTAADVADIQMPPAPNEEGNVPRRFPLVQDTVLMAGDPVAAVVAATTAEARDAAELVEVDYSSLRLYPTSTTLW